MHQFRIKQKHNGDMHKYKVMKFTTSLHLMAKTGFLSHRPKCQRFACLNLKLFSTISLFLELSIPGPKGDSPNCFEPISELIHSR